MIFINNCLLIQLERNVLSPVIFTSLVSILLESLIYSFDLESQPMINYYNHGFFESCFRSSSYFILRHRTKELNRVAAARFNLWAYIYIFFFL